MSAETCLFSNARMEVGQWIQFSTQEDLNNVSEDARDIYQENRRFFVISKENLPSYTVSAYLMDIEDRVYTYRIKEGNPFLNNICLLMDTKIGAVSEENVKATYGDNKVRSIYEVAIRNHLTETGKGLAKSSFGKNNDVESESVLHRYLGSQRFFATQNWD